MTMLKFASFEFWHFVLKSSKFGLIPKIRISQPQLFKRHLPIFHIEVCWKFQEIWPTGSTENNPRKKPEHLFCSKTQSKLGPGFSLGFGPIQFLTYPSQGHLKSRMISHQGAAVKPQHSSHWLHHNSWQSSYHGFLTAKRKVQKKHEQPQKRGQICEKLGSLRHV